MSSIIDPNNEAELAETVKRPRVEPKTELELLNKQANRRGNLKSISTLSALIIFIVLNLVIQLSHNTFDGNSDTVGGVYRLQTCEHLGTTPEIMFLGSSLTMNSTDGHTVDNTMQQDFGVNTVSCNFGTVGSTFELDYYKLKRLISDGYKPRMVVEALWEYNLNEDALTYADDPTHPNWIIDWQELKAQNWSQIRYLAAPGDLPTLYPDHFASVPTGAVGAVDLLLNSYLPIYRESHGILSAICGTKKAGPCGAPLSQNFLQSYKTSDAQGYIHGSSSSVATDLSPAELKSSYSTYFASYRKYVAGMRIGDSDLKYLIMLEALANQYHIPMVNIIPPLNRFFYGYFDTPTIWGQIEQTFQNASAQEQVPLVNMSQLPQFTDADFVDPSHLNYSGAEKYSIWMAIHVINPTLSGGTIG